MTLLFDVHDSEGGGTKTSRKRATAAAVVDEPVFTHAPRAYVVAAPKILGRIDHTYDCADAACGTQCHDLMLEECGQWYLVCAFCGTGQWAVALEVEPEVDETPAEDVFRLPAGGRFSGLTLVEVEKLEDGAAYITWAARKHGRSDVQEACKAHLDRPGGTR